MSQHRRDEDKELFQMVESCMVRLLPNKDALAELVSKGKQISPKTYQRIKRQIKEETKERLKIINSYGRSKYLLETLQLFEETKKETLAEIKKSDDPWFKINARMFVMRIQKDKARFFDATLDFV